VNNLYLSDRHCLFGVDVDNFPGTAPVEWGHEAPMAPLGQLPFFFDLSIFLKAAGLFDALASPLLYGSPTPPKKGCPLDLESRNGAHPSGSAARLPDKNLDDCGRELIEISGERRRFEPNKQFREEIFASASITGLNLISFTDGW